MTPARFAGSAARLARLSAMLLACAAWSLAPIGTAAAPVPSVATGDLPAIQRAGVLRLLVTAPEQLQRAGDPKKEELALAVAFARKLGLRAVPVVVSDRSQLIPALRAGRGDIVVGSLAITPERAEQVAFSRPVRYVAQQVVVPKADRSLRRPADLAGKTVTVRASSSYASTLARLQARVKGVEIKPARETEDTFDLIQKVARGEEAITVADSDILAAALTFEPGVKAAFTLAERDAIAWGVRKENSALKAALDAFLVERALTGYKDRSVRADLEAIRKRGVLRVLTRNSSTTYFLHRGEELGFEYELVREFARTLGVRLEMVVPPSREALAAYLREGKGDLIAAGLAVTPERRREFAFTAPYNWVSEILVVPAKDRTTKSLADLRGRKIAVRRSSSYYQALAPLQAQHGFEIEPVPEEEETEDILEALGEGKLAATVADSNIVDVELTYSDAIRGAGPIDDPREIAWMLRKDQPQLRAAADRFIRRIYRSTFYNLTVTKYFRNERLMRTAASEERSDKAGQLSPYDPLVKKYATMYEFDWRLVTSQMYQESRFDPRVRSWVGALGLMQVMPRTARELGVRDVRQPEQGIHAGVKLLARYHAMYQEPEIGEQDRLRFTLAAYNCGPGHVADARRVAADLKLDPNRWFGQVEKAMPLLAKPRFARTARYGFCRCGEPVKYVSEVQRRYESYSSLIALN
ncbi:MAG TPA: transporter substrate-binding domain-containing protein [Methylomirabilota bacterium]